MCKKAIATVTHRTIGHTAKGVFVVRFIRSVDYCYYVQQKQIKWIGIESTLKRDTEKEWVREGGREMVTVSVRDSPDSQHLTRTCVRVLSTDWQIVPNERYDFDANRSQLNFDLTSQPTRPTKNHLIEFRLLDKFSRLKAKCERAWRRQQIVGPGAPCVR